MISGFEASDGDVFEFVGPPGASVLGDRFMFLCDNNQTLVLRNASLAPSEGGTDVGIYMCRINGMEATFFILSLDRECCHV